MTLVALTFFLGTAVFAMPLIAGSGPLRWPAVAVLAGVLLVLAEVMSSQVLLSQIGNFLVWSGSAAFAWLLVRGEVGAPAGAGTGEARSVLASAVLQALAGLDALFDCQVAQILTSMCG